MSEDATMNAAELALAKFILGPWVRLFNDMRATLISPPQLIGSFLDVLLQGVLFCQASKMQRSQPRPDLLT